MNPSPMLSLAGFVAHLWQASLFGLLIAAFLLWVPRIPARLRYLAGCLALLRFVLPLGFLPAWQEYLPLAAGQLAWLPSSLSSDWMPAFVVHGPSRSLLVPGGFSVSIISLLLVLWGLGALLLLGLGLLRLLRGMAALRNCCVPLAGPHRDCFERTLARSGLARGSVAAFTVPSSHWLGVVGYFRSRVIIPEGLLSELDDREVSSLLLHELMHVRRRDNLLRLFQSVVVALFWFHPLVWWLDRRLRWESEAACDEGVLRLTGANQVYASGLFKATRYALGLNLPGVSGMSRLGLQSRIQAVLNHQNDRETPMKLALIVGTLIGAFGLTTLVASTPETAGASAPAASSSPATSSARIFNVSELDKSPSFVKSPPPLYPVELYPKDEKQPGVQAELVVSFIVDELGDLSQLKVVRSSDSRFDASVMAALPQWKFSPGLKGGTAVKVAMSMPIVFSIEAPK